MHVEVVTEADVPRRPRLEDPPVGQLAVEKLVVAVRGGLLVDALREHLGLGMPSRQIAGRAAPWLIQRSEPGTNEVGGVLIHVGHCSGGNGCASPVERMLLRAGSEIGDQFQSVTD